MNTGVDHFSLHKLGVIALRTIKKLPVFELQTRQRNCVLWKDTFSKRTMFILVGHMGKGTHGYAEQFGNVLGKHKKVRVAALCSHQTKGYQNLNTILIWLQTICWCIS